MIISIDEPCVNCGNDKKENYKEYDGLLGYEAIICQVCGYIYDHTGAHPPEIKEMTLADHAETWWREKGNTVPARNTKEYNSMYEEWIKFAFQGFPE